MVLLAIFQAAVSETLLKQPIISNTLQPVWITHKTGIRSLLGGSDQAYFTTECWGSHKLPVNSCELEDLTQSADPVGKSAFPVGQLGCGWSLVHREEPMRRGPVTRHGHSGEKHSSWHPPAHHNQALLLRYLCTKRGSFTPLFRNNLVFTRYLILFPHKICCATYTLYRHAHRGQTLIYQCSS